MQCVAVLTFYDERTQHAYKRKKNKIGILCEKISCFSRTRFVNLLIRNVRYTGEVAVADIDMSSLQLPSHRPTATGRRDFHWIHSLCNFLPANVQTTLPTEHCVVSVGTLNAFLATNIETTLPTNTGYSQCHFYQQTSRLHYRLNTGYAQCLFYQQKWRQYYRLNPGYSHCRLLQPSSGPVVTTLNDKYSRITQAVNHK